MKDKIIDEIKEIFTQSRSWVKLEVEYVKLTAAEKFTILLSTLILGAVCLLIAMVVLILLAFACVDLFKLIMDPALACLSVSGILVLLIAVIFLLRKPLLLNPIARFITKLFFDTNPSKK
ncbi:MAG: hypothetical protein NC097_07925 [Clostridium sp.]|nr:phage holin family protein [Prevotella sp.]MCM1429707.1 hypothetical protein [Clostridium sp.]MCM1474633.1 phage holin family protein [Muribaculaceae bacterium]